MSCATSIGDQLQRAIKKGDYDTCLQIIDSELNENTPPAAQAQSQSSAKTKANKLNLNIMVNRRLPLAIACEYNYYEIVQLLLKNGADVNQFDFFDQTALLYAVNSSDVDLIQLLIDNGALVNKCDSNGTSPLHIAICRKNDEICDCLIRNEADISVRDKQGSTPLSLSIASEYAYMINLLISKGADVNVCDSNGDTPLIKAIWSTNIAPDELLQIIHNLLIHGADINFMNKSGRTALFTSVYQNNTQLSLYLLEHGANYRLDNLMMAISNFTLLHYACFQGNLILAEKLIERNSDVNALADNNETPLYIATTKAHLNIVDLLVRHGANVNTFTGSETDNKCTPMQAAVYYVTDYKLFKAIVDKLIEGNADLSIDVPGPLLILCLQYNKYDFAKYLIANGAHVDQRTVFNQSCLYKAFLSKNIEFMEMCINAGYDVYDEAWIVDYLENPDFIECPNYYLSERNRLQANYGPVNNLFHHHNHHQRSEDELSTFLDEEEYFDRRYRPKASHKSLKEYNELKRDIYELLRNRCMNPLSLKQLARVKIRQVLLKNDYRIKIKIMEHLPLPQRLKDYLFLNEFNL